MYHKHTWFLSGLLPVVFSIIFLVACSSKSSTFASNQNGQLEGVIKDANTKNLISFATVQVGDSVDVTGDVGIFVFEELDVGEKSVTVTRIGYKTFSGTATVVRGETANLSIEMTPGNPGDTQAPIVPTNVVANEESNGGIIQIRLVWTPSTDNVGIAGYMIYRDGTQFASTAQTSFVDAKLDACYFVTAFDEAGNESVQSDYVCIGKASPLAVNNAPKAKIITSLDAIPIARWGFGNCDATDDSGNGYDGSVSGNIECVDGKTGKALDFDGSDDHITLSKTLNPNEMRSISFWFNSRGADGVNNNGMVLAKYSWYGNRSFLIWSFSGNLNTVGAIFYPDGNSHDGDMISSFYEDVNSLDTDKYTVINNKELEINTWQHVVINVTDSEIEIWINGTITNKVKRDYETYFNSGETTYIGNSFLIGDDFVYNERLNGMLDGFVIYGRPLKDWEIKRLASNPGVTLEYSEKEAITLLGQGSDKEDGELTGESLTWFSNIDGQLGTGSEITTTLSVGMHLVTLEAKDSSSAVATESIHVRVSQLISNEETKVTRLSCKDMLSSGDSTGDGVYAIDPDGPEGQDPINAECNMSFVGGGWTKLTDVVSNTRLNTDSTASREYLYVKNGFWYRSPMSNLVWDWNKGKVLIGDYAYSEGGSFFCNSSKEVTLYGVSCSNGPSNRWKALIYYNTGKDPANAQIQLCQDRPGIFGSACQLGVTVYIREQ